MEKYKYFVLIMFFLPKFIYAQTGSGTYEDPYTGTLSQSRSWSGTTWVTGDITVNNGYTLTFNPGATIVFKATGNFIITGGGILSADGGPDANTIRITADFDNDANFGETGERWGHISFQSSAGASLIDNCIIEYGDVSGNSYPNNWGGGIYVDYNNLTITNCLIQHNKAEWGGGIAVNDYKSCDIEKCYLFDNQATEGGGGVLISTGAGSTIENSVFYSNTCQGITLDINTGGGLSTWFGAINVINCTFVNNTSARTLGQGIQIYQSSDSKIINSIFWGSNEQAYVFGTYSINYSGFQNIDKAGTGNINLSSSNNSITGPHFVNPGPTGTIDLSIKVVSPCLDAGTSSGTPVTDYLGNSRVRNYDMGAYEVQYNYWMTSASSTDWATGSNWNDGVPTNSQDIVIPTGATNYPTGSTTQDYEIGTGKGMVLEPGAKVTLDQITNNGDLKLRSDGSNISSIIFNNTGISAIIELYLTGGGSLGSYRWHYISIPTTTTVPVSTFTGITLDIVGYNEPRVSSDVSQGWIGYDGWIYCTPEVDYDATYAFSNLTLGRGYEYWDNSTYKFTFSGTLNTSDISPVVTFKTGGVSEVNGFNLIGNPFPSGLDWNYIIAHNFPENTSKSLYFTRNNTLCSYINGVGVPSDVNGYIPPMQGFMTKTYVENHNIPLVAAARIHTMHARYKGEPIIPLVRLSLDEDPFSDETVIRFDNEAKSDLDNDFDAIKMSVSPEDLLIYSSISGINYVINGQPFPVTSLDIPIIINLLSSGNHTITSTQLQGLDDYNVYLIDNTTGFIANLKTTPIVTFAASSGLISDRFILKISNIATTIENPIMPDNTFNIYYGFDMINIQVISDEWEGKSGAVKVLDLSGKTITDLKNSEFSKNSLTQIPAPNAKGLYMIEIRSGMKRFVGKVIVK